MSEESFNYSNERFADLQMLRYRLDNFEKLSLRQKCLVYCLSKATLYGRDITFDQFGKYNLKIRKILEAVFCYYDGNRNSKEFKALETYLKRVWFSNGIYHHYGTEKFQPEFAEDFFRKAVLSIDTTKLPLTGQDAPEQLLDEICPVIFNPEILPKRVNKSDGEDLIKTSACNYYDGLTQREVEDFYSCKKTSNENQPSWGLNSTLVKSEDGIHEEVWRLDGKYGKAISKIVLWLQKAIGYAENESQKHVIELLIDYYKSGDLREFDKYSIAWVEEKDSAIDFINGFIEVYGDPLGLKGSWEGIVEYRDNKATERAQTISSNAQWFEDHSPVDPRFRKPIVKGVSAKVICAAMLGGDEYPSSAIGINLPNAEWIRAQYGSKSVTISNLTHAYDMAAKGNGFKEEFVIDKGTRNLIEKYGDRCDDLHTDLHECLGHGSGQLLPGTDPDALKNYGNTIEEARADLFGLYYIADEKLIELGLLDSKEAYKAQYYVYIMNGLMTQLVRIKPGHKIEEAHMRNRALIAQWAYDTNPEIIELVKRDGRTYVRINDYEALREVFARQLAEIQRIKSEGDFDAARNLVEKYAVNVDESLHQEVLERYSKLNIAPYKGFINPVLTLVRDKDGNVKDVTVDYTETYEHQMLRYSSEYGTLI